MMDSPPLFATNRHRPLRVAALLPQPAGGLTAIDGVDAAVGILGLASGRDPRAVGVARLRAPGAFTTARQPAAWTARP